MGGFGGGEVPARPGYPFIPGGAPAVFKNTIRARMCIHAGGFTAIAWRGAAARNIYISARNGSLARVARCVHAMAPALRAHAWPCLSVLGGRRELVRVQLRVACVQCVLCKVCG